MKLFLSKNERFLLNGPAGKIEVITALTSYAKKAVMGIICHPHPLYGGTMNNKVVITTAKAFEQLGVKTVRFNFRGVGKSEGHYDNAVGEADDLKAILRWVKEEACPNDEIWLAGFSFGSYVAAKVANTDTDISRLITIAPAVNNYNYKVFTNIVCPWLVVVGTQDELVPLEEVKAFVGQSPITVRFIVIEEASHFFHGKLIELRETLVSELS
ncbi:MAG: alpha/beta hydrolase [Coxiella endosymbiont of Haemaphysalis qinghaiensis]